MPDKAAKTGSVAATEPVKDINEGGTDKVVSGSAWMTAGSIFSRILGAIYIIPWAMWFGSNYNQANALYAKGYNIYSFFLMVAIAGIPSAVSKQVAHYNAINEYAVGQRLFKRGLLLAGALGLLFGLILWFGATPINAILGGSDPRMIPVLHSLAIALVIIPPMSLTRGFFQGYQRMAPSAISQFFEQLIRVLYMLGSAFVIMRVQHGDWGNAVTQSTFAAFIGAAGSSLLLGWYYMRSLPTLNRLADQSRGELAIPVLHLFQEIIMQAIPFIVIDASVTIYNLIDQATFQPIMQQVYHLPVRTINVLYAAFAFNSNKLIMIVVSMASAIAIAIVPVLSEAYSLHQIKAVRNRLSDAIVMFWIIMLPGSMGMAAIAKPLNTLFYRYSELGTIVLQFSAFVAIIIGLFTVASALMQGLSRNRDVIRYFLIGLIVKIVVQYPCIAVFSTLGPLIATTIGLVVSIVLIFRDLNANFGFSVQPLLRPINRVILYSLFTYLAASAVVWLSYLFLNPASKVQSILVTLVAVFVGAGIYLYCILRSRIADLLLGTRADGLRRRLRIK